mgnify:CR=1 FL=1|jgi:hypothetical protein
MFSFSYSCFLRNIIASGAVLFLFSCGSGDTTPPLETTDSILPKKADTLTQEAPPKIEVRRNFDRTPDDIALFLAGLPPRDKSLIDPAYRESPEWKKYASIAKGRWKVFDSTRVSKISLWRDQELDALNKEIKTLYYPFSGPDILNANLFFPQAKEYIMVGLEPVGEIPFTEKYVVDTLGKYFQSVNNSLYAILNFSFFRTVAMKKDLQGEQVNGTTPLMLLFLSRRGNEIIEVKKVSLSPEGNLQYSESGKPKGVEITFRKDTLSPEQKVIYFRADLSNEGMLKTNLELKKFISSKGTVHTYLKSASYLMHNKFFSEVRDQILAQSKGLLQDDSGIPYSFFDKSIWDITLYGKYTGTISLFKNEYQADYKEAFSQDSAARKLKPLPFGIGYKWHEGTSNLLMARKK